MPGSSSLASPFGSRRSQRIAIVVADRALGLPGGEGPERLQLSDDGWCRAPPTGMRDLDRRPDRKATEQVLANVE